jgi:hypothetical protein
MEANIQVRAFNAEWDCRKNKKPANLSEFQFFLFRIIFYQFQENGKICALTRIILQDNVQ